MIKFNKSVDLGMQYLEFGVNYAVFYDELVP